MTTNDIVEANPIATGIDLAELVKLCAVDPELYAKSFFSKTFRQAQPSFAASMWEPLEDPRARLVNLVAFRGSSKTTRLRTFASRRIAYGMSRTILCIGATERDAIRSVVWLRNQFTRNHLWRQAFNLKQGSKWDETQIEIEHGTFGHNIWILAAGVSGSLRGINFDDYRPDLIIVDDPQTDESAATGEQREKLSDLILGAVKNSLAPETEEPNAKIVMAITPQHREDISQLALKDPQWVSRVYPCWTKETIDFDVDQQVSSWPERFPTEGLRNDKRLAARRRKLSVFCREQECRLITAEKTHFQPTWLQIREPGICPPKGIFAVLAIDPVPPPSDRQRSKGKLTGDFEAHYVWGRYQGVYHLLDCARSRGHQPSWSVATALSLARKWRVAKIVVETVAYQRTLKWLIQQEMARRGQFHVVVESDDKMEKFALITNVIGGLAQQGLLAVGSEHTEFITQFEEFGPLYSGIDDDLDASARALQELANPYLETEAMLDDSHVEELEYVRSCP